MEGERLRALPLGENATGGGLILTSMALTALGVVMVFSTSAASTTPLAWHERADVRQALFAAVGVGLLWCLWRVDYHRLLRRPWPGRRLLRRVPSPAAVLLVVAVAASAAVLVPGVGYAVGGFRRWIRFGPIGFQPSELLKVAVLVALAAYLSGDETRARSLRRGVLPAVGLIALAAGLVVTQDFGTAAILALAGGAVLLLAGVRWYYLAAMVPLLAGGFWGFVVRSPHRWARIEAMLHPFDPSNPAAYQPRQSLIAIASGGLAPPGLGGGVAKFGYLPEDSTDFIYSIICEELGLAGAVVVIGLVLVWLGLARRAAANAPDRFGSLLAGGLGLLVCLQAVLHLAVAVVWAPPTGVSMPFVSAGGSSLLTMCAATALIVSVSSRRCGREAQARLRQGPA